MAALEAAIQGGLSGSGGSFLASYSTAQEWVPWD
jgi:hypothetical protein